MGKNKGIHSSHRMPATLAAATRSRGMQPPLVFSFFYAPPAVFAQSTEIQPQPITYGVRVCEREMSVWSAVVVEKYIHSHQPNSNGAKTKTKTNRQKTLYIHTHIFPICMTPPPTTEGTREIQKCYILSDKIRDLCGLSPSFLPSHSAVCTCTCIAFSSASRASWAASCPMTLACISGAKYIPIKPPGQRSLINPNGVGGWERPRRIDR